ncbi:trifunctional serine/threonine-protein kinase/ATP-binding protein/sensor histidine kinase [Cylindrospermum sp. FACHB-282]|uniref:trifunctional serine/threonine-protein kinase/ATP-binding protein/sensor histidine kinase n=1 Tax=Cylindrospermum sp. FACHB-282 TaxID=2692794 RepID=UPI00168660FE|nr:ATP-binding sensor histidine kinase [Cylindrospermum sp. FACHB-282]MBD2387084.1 AAA family ATPase [Cylindrospermum sp. FACHB-282]
MVSTQVNIPGYQVNEELYNGSRTIVYRGYRKIDSVPVIMKLLKKTYPIFSELVQFRNQYTIAKNLNIPGIIQTYSLERYENGYVLVMEDFGGISLNNFTKVETWDKTSLKEFLQMAISLCNTLDILYHHRVIHKDIKPANILINPQTKQIKLIDFSTSSLLPKETQTLISPNLLEGTLAYISPEQTGRMNRGIDYRTDFYSLGVTFYQLLTGELPYQSEDAMELVHCHIAQAPPLVHNINPQIPDVLSDIVNKLMVKNAEGRYQSALGLKHDLEKCLTQIEETGTIQNFPIAQRDVSDKFIISDKLYGRENEVKTLLQAFERVSQGVTEMMLVVGFSGIGKTVVVNEVHKPIVRQRGYFIKGKYDQFNRNIPFSAFVQAFRDLMGQLLTESHTQIQQWKSKILAVVGENGQVIIDVIPELESIIGQQSTAIELSGNDAQNRFDLLFHNFVQVFTTKEHPLVMFLDDLQWADSASLNLMQLLMSESARGYLLLIGAYRDNEVSAAHPLVLSLEEIKKSSATVNAITLEPLSNFSLNQLVADTLSCSSEVAQPLTQLVYQKTKGNPFFSTQFLKALYADGLIRFDWNGGNWQCDITEVKALALTDNVVDFMALQLQKLPLKTQSVFKLAACIGNQFDLATLAIVSQQSQIETAACLWKGLQEELILPTNEIYKFFLGRETQDTATDSQIVNYKFLHDRVQQAAYSLIPEEQRATTHYQIGQLLLEQISPSSREDRIFELVNQLNYGKALIAQQAERDQLAQLNLTACRKARGATAYQAAREYATVGLSLLAENAWQQQYEMSLALHELATEVASLCGEFEAMEQLIEIVTTQAHSLPEKVNVYRVKIQADISGQKFAQAIAIAQHFVEQLGVTFPQAPTPSDYQQAIQEINDIIGDRNIEDFALLPVMTDAEKIAIVQVANSVIPAAYAGVSPLFQLLICLSVKLSLLYGNIAVSSSAYAWYGIILCSFLQDINTATKFSRLALQTLSKFDAKTTKPNVLALLGTFLVHRKSHIKETLPLVQEGYTTALEVGNLEFVGHNVSIICYNSFWCGQPLPALAENTRIYHNELVQLKQLNTANYCHVDWQCLLNLLGYVENRTILSGEVLEEKEFLSLLLSANDILGLYHFYLSKLLLCFLFEEIEQANNFAGKVRCYLMGGAGSVGEPGFYFYDSLIALAQLSQHSDEQSEVLERVAQNQIQLQQHWANHAPMNHQHKVDLVEAEKYRVLGKKYEAGDWYDRAIALAKENEYIQEEALANELAAKFYLDWGREKIATDYMQEAYYCYARWGAKAKTDHLEQRYPQFLQPILQQRQLNLNPLETIGYAVTHSPTHTSSSSSNISDVLDFTSLLKAAQAISSSLELNELIANLTRIILENSGAKKCALILPQEDTWQVKVITLMDIQTITTPQLLDNCPDIPVHLIHYVKNTQKTVVIDNCKTDIPGVIREYMLQYQPQSVLCTPMINQGNLVGILYLENQLTSGVFPRECLQVINLLSSQAAISLENARLYQQAQRALQDLQQAQLKIVQSEKMSALGNLVAGVAHEMNNPLGFITATLEQAKPNVADILEHLKLYQAILPNPSEEILDHAEEMDLDYTSEDLPKMIDSMAIACDRLKNISTSLRTFSRADQDYKVPFNIHHGIDSTILILKHRLKSNDKRPAIEVMNTYGNLHPVECFPGQLNQVFMNILANAIDALDESSAGRSFSEIKNNPNQIIITTSMVDNNVVKISIADNGKGMSEAVKQKIFDHLFTTKTVGKGTGLGLAIARQIVVEKHRGIIEVNSRLGEGTEFIISLPICAVSN